MAEAMTYRLTVTYAAGNDQVHRGLDADRAYSGAGAFLRDLTSLEGRGVKRVLVEAEGEADDVRVGLVH